MGFKVDVSAITLLLLLAFTGQTQSAVFNVRRYGAGSSGSDITMALLRAWKDACAATTPSQIVIPKGTHSLGLATMEGPCKAPIDLRVRGTIKAPANPSSLGDGSWVTFQHVNDLTVSGGGTFDGQGEIAWKQNDCNKNSNCKALAINLRFNFVTNGLVQDITSLNSKNFHVNILGCKNLTFQHFTVTAPAHSLNTDGIHIGRSVGVKIINTNIGTGDDCISLGDGSQQINITKVTCGPGHGISVGSLGRYPKEDPVSGIFVKNCTMSNTDNGVRIKSWPGLYGNTATNMHFEDIIMNNVGNPVLIDQVYCPWNQCNKKAPSKVSISNVSFKKIRGTSTTPVAVQLSCSSGIPCKDVVLSDINLVYAGTQGAASSMCSFVKPRILGVLKPAGC